MMICALCVICERLKHRSIGILRDRENDLEFNSQTKSILSLKTQCELDFSIDFHARLRKILSLKFNQNQGDQHSIVSQYL